MTVLCECGCGEPAPIATRHRPDRGQRKGNPVRFVRGHATVGRLLPPRRTTITAADYSVEDRGHDTPCWVWRGFVDVEGYGRVESQLQQWRAHRLSWTLFVGPVPEGLELDHLCRVKACIRPSHLEPVTKDENLRRMHEHRASVRA